jgi:hypothetical protein
MEVSTLVADFRRTRDAVRGRHAVAVEELPAPPDRLATALVEASRNTTDPGAARRLAEDLVDLQAFVDLRGEAAPTPPPAGQPPSRILVRIRERQAAAIAFLRNDPSVVGTVAAQQGRWIAIGDARSALDRTRTYRELQFGGLLGTLTWIVAAPAGAIAARLLGLGEFSLAVAVALFIGWWVSPLLGMFAERIGSMLWERAIQPRWAHASDGLAFALIVGPLMAVQFALGFAILTIISGLEHQS